MTRRRGPRERRILLRSRIALTTALVVALSIAGVSVVAWLVTEHNLRAQLDESLTGALPPPPVSGAGESVPSFDSLCTGMAAEKPLQRFVEGIQILRADGSVCVPAGVDQVLTTAADREVTEPVLRDRTTRDGVRVRAMLRPLGGGDVLVVSRSLDDIDAALAGLRTALLVVSLVGVAVAGAAGLLLTRNALRPMARLTGTAERIARTQDLDTPVDVTGRDEVGRLGRAFAAMTDALTESRRRQQELVSDAAHELRTPLTSLCVNVDLLARSEETGRPIPEERRRTLIASLQSQTGEFTELVGELVTLARDQRTLDRAPVRVHAIIDRAVWRANSRSTGHRVEVRVTPWSTMGDAAALERCVVNLLDNAIKFSRPGSVVSVVSAPGWLSVTDQGPGIPEHHRAHVFERFWRAPEARALPGSGLGLAIVHDTVTAHGGTVRLQHTAGGAGTCIRITLPELGSDRRPPTGEGDVRLEDARVVE